MVSKLPIIWRQTVRSSSADAEGDVDERGATLGGAAHRARQQKLLIQGAEPAEDGSLRLLRCSIRRGGGGDCIAEEGGGVEWSGGVGAAELWGFTMEGARGALHIARRVGHEKAAERQADQVTHRRAITTHA